MHEVPTKSAGRPTQERSWLNRGQWLAASGLMAKMEDAQSTPNADRKMLFSVVQHNYFDMPNIEALNQATVAMAKEQDSQGGSENTKTPKGKGKGKGRGRGRGKGQGPK